MSNDAKTSENTGENALDILQKMTTQGIPVDKVLESMEPKDVVKFLMGQYTQLSERCNSLEDQLRELKEAIKDEGKDTTQRIDRILSLMTAHMTYIKQMIQIEDVNNEKLTDQEKLNAKQELQINGIIERQNRFAVNLKTIDANTKAILKELGKLKAKILKHDRFNACVVYIGSIAMAVGTWLFSGDNLAKLIVALGQFIH